MAGKGEPLVLQGDELDKFRDFLNWSETRHWEIRATDMLGSVFTCGFNVWLSLETGIVDRQIRRIRNELDRVQFSVAERILIALGRVDLLDNGKILATKNPHWSDEGFNKWWRSTP